MSKENNTNSGSSDLTDVGSFWRKEGKTGNKFLSGEVRIGDATYKAFIFPNKKTKDTHPDYRLSLAELSEDMKPPQFGAARTESKPAVKKAVAPEEPQDDIPFN